MRVREAVCSSVMIGLLSGSALGTPGSEYSMDDGAGNFNIGPSTFDARMTWMNAFEAKDGGDTIRLIRAAFGPIANDDGVLGPTAVTVAILNDPTDDFDPSDAVLVGTGVGTWVQGEPNEFLEFAVSPSEVSGVFYVAVEMDVLERANPARMDPQSPTAGTRSWMFYNPASRLDDIGNSKYVLRMADSPFVGGWMIRAVSTGGCEADLTYDGSLDFFDVSAFLSALGEGSAVADFTADGVLDFFDVSAFLGAFGDGCP